MVNSFLRPIQHMLKQRDLKVSDHTIKGFLEDIDQAVPWFGASGDVNLPCWEKLGRDLIEVKGKGELRPGTLLLWRMIRYCLKDGKCVDILREGRRALSAHQDSMSESDNKEKGNLKEERPKSSKASSKLHTKVEKEKETDQGKKEKETDQGKTKQKPSGLYPVLDEFKQKPSGLYPVLDEFADITLSDSAKDELDSEEEEDLEETAAAYWWEREYPQVRIIHYMDDILLATPSQVMLDKAYAHTVQALEKKGLYIAPEKVQKDSIACQGRTWEWRQISKGFSLSPSIKRHLLDSKRYESSSGDGWSWFQWLISNEARGVSVISTLTQLDGIEHHLVNISGNLTDHKGDRRLSHIKENGELFNATLPEAAVCVQPPFVFLLTNATPINNLVDCFKNLRLLAECWNGTWTLAVIVKVPTFVPIPVEADPKTFPILTLLRERQDFGITAAIVAAIALSAASAVTAAVTMTNQIQTAQTINTVVEQTSAVMETQHRINKHLISDIVAANQRMDLIQTQIEELFGLVQIGCIAKLKHMCVTPLRFDEAGNESRMISSYLAGNWTRDAELLMSQQLLQIAALNETRVEPISLGDFTDWLSSAFSFFKEWVGVGIFGAICCFCVVLSLWFLCRLRAQQARDKAVSIQALAALDHGVSPQKIANRSVFVILKKTEVQVDQNIITIQHKLNEKKQLL
ncbi:hypothetical protein STEG23_036493 [Scotinomys teguina]